MAPHSNKARTQPPASGPRARLWPPSWVIVRRLRGGGQHLLTRCCPPRCCPRRTSLIRDAFRMVLPLPAMLPAAAWQARYHYRPEYEASVNSCAALELHASFQCLARVCSLHHHHDMALEHFSRVFLLRSQENSETAESLMFLQNQRGGRVSFLDTRMPETQERESGLQATQDALHLEKRVSQSLLDLYHRATESSDAHLCHFLETRHLDQQLEFIKELADHLTNMRKMGAPEGGLAEYAFDKLTLDTSDKD